MLIQNRSYHSLESLLVGVNFYQDRTVPALKFAVNDAQELSQVLDEISYGFQAHHKDVLLSASAAENQALRRNILRELAWKAQQATEKDLLLFYFSGHGTLSEGDAYLCPSDTEADFIKDTAIPLKRVREILDESRAPVKILIFDACHLGVPLGAKEMKGETKELEENGKAFAEITKNIFEGVRGLAMLASSAREEVSIEVAELRHGLFTHFLLEALRNHRTLDENGDARISVTEVFDRVASKLREHGQQPTIVLEGSGDLPVFPVLPLPAQPNPLRRVFPMPVKDPKDFFGRADELKKVQDQLLNTSDILVFVHGEPKIGKTSFLNRVKVMLDEASTLETRFLYFSIEPAEIDSVETFAREIWNNLQRLCKEYAPLAFEGKTFSFQGYGHFSAELAEALSVFPNFRFVVFLDEIEKIKSITDNVKFHQIIGLLRFLIEQTNLPIAFVVSSFQTQEQFFPSGFGSPPSPLDIKLEPLERSECDEMLASFFSVEGKDILLERIYRLSGGHPYVAKMLAAEIYDALQKSSAAQIVENIAWQRQVSKILLSSEANAFFTSLYSHFSDEERYVFLFLARRPQYLLEGRELSLWRAVYRSATSQLENEKSYLLRMPDGGYQLRLQLFGDWLKNWEKFPLESERLGLPASSLTHSIPTDGICINEAQGKVYRDGQEVTLSQLQYQTLLYLARNMGRVVPREELYEHLHSDNEAYIATDQSLDALVYRLRLVLGDREQRYLQTLRKRGYLLEHVTFIPR